MARLLIALQVEVQEVETATLQSQLAGLKTTKESSAEVLKQALAQKEGEEAAYKRIIDGNAARLLEMQQERDVYDQRLKELEAEHERYKTEMMELLEATGETVMPKSELHKALNSQSARIDELYRLLKKPEEVPKRRVWDDNLQIFVEKPDLPRKSSLAISSAPLFKLEETFKHDEATSRTRLDLELELAATKREFHTLESEVEQLRDLKESLAAAQAEVASARVLTAPRAPSSISITVEGEAKVRRVSRDQLSSAIHVVGKQPVVTNEDRKLIFNQFHDLRLDTSTDDAASQAVIRDDVSLAAQQPMRAARSVAAGTKHTLAATVSPRASGSPAAARAAAPSPSIKSPTTKVPGAHLLREDIVIPIRPITPTDGSEEITLEGEEWMFDPKIQKLLKIKEEARSKVSKLRLESQKKILHLRKTQKHKPQQLSFHEKMAYFTTKDVKLDVAAVEEALRKRDALAAVLPNLDVSGSENA